MKKIAITGQIHSGKSTALAYFKKCGAITLSSDDIVKNLLNEDSVVIQEVKSAFPNAIDKNKINKTKLAEIVFNDPLKLQKLEQILHPYVIFNIKQTYSDSLLKSKKPLFVVEVPLLYETGFEKWFDYTIVMHQTSPLNIKNTKLSPEDIRCRSKRLHPIKYKIQQADFIIDNSKSLQHLLHQVESIATALQRNKEHLKRQ